MYGTYEEKFDAYKAFLGYFMTMPGKKLMFMGGEIGQFLEWRYDDQLEWNLMDNEKHKKLNRFVKELNHFYIDNAALWEYEDSWDGFKWINDSDNENSVFTYIRRGKKKDDYVYVIVNFTPVDRPVYKIGVPEAGSYEVVMHSNSTKYGGSRLIGKKSFRAKREQYSDMAYTLKVFADANSVMLLKKKKTDVQKNDAKENTVSKTTAKKQINNK